MLAEQQTEPLHISITEVSGARVSEEQIQRVCDRYYWAGSYCSGKDVIEISCGTGVGLNYLATQSRSFEAGDYLQDNLNLALKHYGERIKLRHLDAHALPYPEATFDVVVCLEALYFYASIDQALKEFHRILRSGGKLLLSGPNPDLFDFHPSKFATQYFGVKEYHEVLNKHGFSVELFGDTPINKVSLRQKILRPLKAFAAKSGLMPQTKRGKRIFRRLFFGELKQMPSEIDEHTRKQTESVRITSPEPDHRYKILFCVATKRE